MKKLLLVFLAALLFLVGCAVKEPVETTWKYEYDATVPTTLIRPPVPTDPIPQTYPPDYAAPTEPPETISVQYVPLNVNNPNNLPVLKWLCAVDGWTGGRTHPWSENALLQLNDMLEQRSAPFRVQMVIVSSNQYIHYKDWSSVPEFQKQLTEADLVFGLMNQVQMTETLAPITSYIGRGGALENAVPHSMFWCSTTWNGETYAIPCGLQNAVSTGWKVSPYLLEVSGLAPEDLQKNFWEMDEIFARIYDANGGKGFLHYNGDDSEMVLNQRSSTQSLVPEAVYAYLYGRVQMIGSCFGIDYTSGYPTVVNVLELEEVRLIQEAMIRYKKAGYITGSTKGDYMRYTTLDADRIYTIDGEEKICIPVTDPVFPQQNYEHVTGIAAGSDHKAEARMLLELIAEDEAFRMQLLFGVDGQDYTVEDGYYKQITSVSGIRYRMDFLSPLSLFSGLKLAPDDYSTSAVFADSACIPGETGEEKLASLRAHLDRSRALDPVQFDLRGYEEEFEQIYWNIRRYYPYYTNHKHYIAAYGDQHKPEMTPALYDLMLEDLREAGSDSIQWELQYQLEKWLKENP